MVQNFYITTPIYYVNANPHLGHAYTTIVADAVTRFHKMLGERTLFLTGTDEHGDKIVQAAEKNNATPKQFVDEISGHFRSLWPRLGINCNHFCRTTDEKHKRIVQLMLQRIYDAGDIYFGEFGGHYCYGCERFYTEKELENGLCPQHLTKPAFISEKNYFFRMSKYLPWLREFLDAHPDVIRPERYFRETMGMLDSGDLEDLCISRPKSRLTWGIELPFDKNYVCYVWFDALLTYLGGLDWPDGQEFKEFWPGEHLIAKDILKPHAIFWPCMLKAAGIPVYKHLNVHGYWLSRNTKMSKSLGNIVEPLAEVEHYGLDAFRYFLLREMRFGSDASFGEEIIVSRINADLANDLGNLFSRVLSMNGKYFAGQTPAAGTLEEVDREILGLGRDSMKNFVQLFEIMDFAQALEALWQFVGALNRYVDAQAPWSLHKEGRVERLATVMALLIASLGKIAICLWPVMPDASLAMLNQLGGRNGKPYENNSEPPINDLRAETDNFDLEKAGTVTAVSSNLFPRIEVKTMPDSKKASPKSKGKSENTGQIQEKAPVDIEVFNTLDMCTGTIVKAEKHPNADRILVLQIDFGERGQRQILSGIAETYRPEELEGRPVCAVLNLPPRKIRGCLSMGMVLTTQDKEKIRLLEPAREMANGSHIC